MAILGEQAVGSIVKLNVNGAAWDFIVVHQGLPGTMYDPTCDGTWLLMKDCYIAKAFDSTDNDYSNSDVHSYLNNNFVNLLDDGVKNACETAKIPYVKGAGASGTLITGASGLSVNAFLLSRTELGFSATITAFTEGAALSYFKSNDNAKRKATYNGSPCAWWTRSPWNNGSAKNQAYDIGFAGSDFYNGVTDASTCVRPALICPYNMIVNDNGLVDGTMLSTGAITGTVLIDGVQRELTGKGYINIGGVLRELSDSQVNTGGVLKSLKG